MEVDLDRLVEYVCGPNWRYATENCQDVISSLKDTYSSSDQYFWHRVSQFEARAIALGLYDNEPSFRDSDWEEQDLGVADPLDLDE